MISVALRYKAIYLDVNTHDIDMQSEATAPVMAFVERLAENGYCVSEQLLHALNGVSATLLAEITHCINDVLGVELNWVPLVKGWKVPTGETLTDHVFTFFANALRGHISLKGTTLPCGHLIPEGTFPIERYNGCPYCGTPFATSSFVYRGQTSKLKELRLMTKADMQRVFASLLSSATPLDGTQKDSLEQLLGVLPLPSGVEIKMKDTAMIVVKWLVAQGRDDEAGALLATPTDVLRYLWYEKTGQAQIIEPKTLVAHARRLYLHMWGPLDRGADAATHMKQKLMLKYDRRACRRVATWLNSVGMSAAAAAENMHPKRGMWVRMIRALRLGEYSRKPGFEHLAEILDVFYNRRYTVFQGQIDVARRQNDAARTLMLLQQRPGLFARCLFATMLRFGSEQVLKAFDEVADNMPARLLLSLGNAAESYFATTNERYARPITGGSHKIEPNKLLILYTDADLKRMAEAVMQLYSASMRRRFAATPTTSKTIFIAPELYDIPVSVGDRAESIQDVSCALMGMRFPVEGNNVRLFLQWGKGLPAQHLDMDLSCRIVLPDDQVAECAYYNLTCVGAKHSGDIQSIPHMVGTAEYIELDICELQKAGARYAVFTCNAYSCGSLSPNLVVGWMDSKYPMKVSEKNGVAYDPSCVQHMVRVDDHTLSKAMVFGVLDVAKREIIWLEMPFTAQTLRGADGSAIEALLAKLDAKLKIGELLNMKAEAQNLQVVTSPEEADESYTYEWALNPAEVTSLLNG